MVTFHSRKSIFGRKNPFFPARSQESHLKFLYEHGGDGALSDKLKNSNLVCGYIFARLKFDHIPSGSVSSSPCPPRKPRGCS